MQTVQLVAQLVDQAQQQAPPSNGIGADGWKIISALCTFIGGLILWLRATIKEVNDAKDARIADLQHNLDVSREDNKAG